MICNEENTDGRARMTTDEERVLHVDSDRTEVILIVMFVNWLAVRTLKASDRSYIECVR